MKTVIKFFLVFSVAFVLSAVILFADINADLYFNSWLTNAATGWKWYNCFTSPGHSLSILFLKGGYLWLIAPAIFSFFISCGAIIISRITSQ